MNRNGRMHGVTHATGMSAKGGNVRGTPSDKLGVAAPSPKTVKSGTAVNPQPKKQPGATAPGAKHTTH
jgi:hypothetical protein